jgi:hypothetical protein
MTIRKFILTLTVFAFIGLPTTSKAASACESGTTFSNGKSVSNEFRPKKKKKKRHGGGCEAYGGFGQTKMK